MAKSKVAKKVYLVNVDGNVEEFGGAHPDAFGVRFYFHDADKTIREVHFSDISESNNQRLRGHGAMQKLGDSYSGLTAVEAIPEFDAIAELLGTDDWTQTREGTAGPRIGQLVAAFARAKGIALDAAQGVFEGWKEELEDDEYKEMLVKVKASQKIKNAILEIKAEELAAEEATDDVLDTL